MSLKYGKVLEFIFVFISPFVLMFAIFNLVNLRSACMAEKRKMAKVISETENLKDEYNALQILYYSTVKPENVDKMTKKMKSLKEDEVFYIE